MHCVSIIYIHSYFDIKGQYFLKSGTITTGFKNCSNLNVNSASKLCLTNRHRMQTHLIPTFHFERVAKTEIS